MGVRDPQRVVVLDGVVEALGVIVGKSCLHLPEQGAECGGDGSLSLCGRVRGAVGPHAPGDRLPVCVLCLNVASGRIEIARRKELEQLAADLVTARIRALVEERRGVADTGGVAMPAFLSWGRS